jgi:alpha-tubulin suppressor-like RCC1 family protein
VAAGYTHTVAIKTDGTLWSWGRNREGQLEDGTKTGKPTPAQVGIDTTWRSVAAGGNHTVAIKTDETMWSWGANNWSGQLGDDRYTNTSTPNQVGMDMDFNWKSVDAGYAHTVAVKTDGTLWVSDQRAEAELHTLRELRVCATGGH